MSKDMDRRKFLGIASGTALAALTVGEGVAHAAAEASTAISINGASGGRTFDGVGGLSGGGGTSRLLFDYPPRNKPKSSITSSSPTMEQVYKFSKLKLAAILIRPMEPKPAPCVVAPIRIIIEVMNGG